MGGRIFPGEAPAQSCCRLLKRELSLEVLPEMPIANFVVCVLEYL